MQAQTKTYKADITMFKQRSKDIGLEFLRQLSFLIKLIETILIALNELIQERNKLLKRNYIPTENY